MAQIPQFNRETRLNGTPTPYEHYNITDDTSGASIAKAGMNVAKGLDELSKASMKINETFEEMKTLEFNNAIEQWKQDNLFDKENGYYFQLGKNAAGKSNEVMQGYDKFVKDWTAGHRLSPRNMARINATAASKKTLIQHGVTAHDFKETNNWANSETELGINNSINSAVSERNNPSAMDIQVQNVRQITRWKGSTLGLDEATVSVMEKENVSRLYSAVLETKLQEGDLSAREFFEKHKEFINPQFHSKYIGAIKNEEDKYKSRELATSIINSSANEQEAVSKAESIKDVNMSDSVLSRVKKHYSQEENFKNQEQKEMLNGFYNKAVEVSKNGGQLSYDDIPDGLDADTKLSLMNYVNKNGQPDTDNQNWEVLYDMRVNNAQGFAKEDLNKYRGFLSETDYRYFLKEQENIKTGDYYTTIKDDDKLIQTALKEVGIKSNAKQDTGFSEIKALTREFEARKGRKITDDELLNITKSLGYKGSDGVMLYKKLEKGLSERTGLTKDIINDFVYYQKQHNGQLPPDNEKYKIIQKRVSQKVQEKKTHAQEIVSGFKGDSITWKNIQYTTPKPNEQKVLTYFADNQIPTISKKLGLNLTVTSRYRNQAGSYHGQGRAADISMSEHNPTNRIRIYEQLLALPTVQAVGCSDPNILAHFNGNKKLVNEIDYDRKHGTNHENHAHVTLINANPAKPVTVAKANVYKF